MVQKAREVIDVGATGKYADWITDDGLTRLSAWARDGMTDKDIADRIGIAWQTLYEWKNKHPEIKEALKKGKEVVDIEVENALLKRALGYSYTETMTETTGGETKTRTTVKHMPPDATAMIYWLKNRKPAQWRDRQQAENKEAIAKLDALIADIDKAARAKGIGQDAAE